MTFERVDLSDSVTLYRGDCLAVLPTLPAKSVQCVVTSPPYWGLRDYSVEGQLGLEQTPEAYVAEMVAVFREVRRVLRDDGTLWLNLGDSYGRGSRVDNVNDNKRGGNANTGHATLTRANGYGGAQRVHIRNKDLVGIPWRVAFALQADGWTLRSEIIWHKPNPMPESVTDRPTKSHEQIFLLTKSARYYYDAEAVKEPFADERMGNPGKYEWRYGDGAHGHRQGIGQKEWNADGSKTGRNRRSVWTVATQPFSGAHFAVFPPKLIEPCILAGTSERGCCPTCGKPWERVVEKKSAYEGARRNDDLEKAGTTRGTGWKSSAQLAADGAYSRTVGWRPTCACGGEIALPEYPAMPADALPPYDCDVCGGTGVDLRKAMAELPPQTNQEYLAFWQSEASAPYLCPACQGQPHRPANDAYNAWQAQYAAVTEERARQFETPTTLRPVLQPVPCTVLDPFGGAGTTALVAIQHGRRAVSIELNAEYIELTRERLAPILAQPPLFRLTPVGADAAGSGQTEQLELSAAPLNFGR